MTDSDQQSGPDPDAWRCIESDPIDEEPHIAFKTEKQAFVSSAYEKEEALWSESTIKQEIDRRIESLEKGFKGDVKDGKIATLEELREVFSGE